MAHQSTFKLIGIVLMVTGIGLAYWGYDMSGGLDSQLNQAFSGTSSDGVVIHHIAGAANFAAGLFLFIINNLMYLQGQSHG